MEREPIEANKHLSSQIAWIWATPHCVLWTIWTLTEEIHRAWTKTPCFYVILPQHTVIFLTCTFTDGNGRLIKKALWVSLMMSDTRHLLWISTNTCKVVIGLGWREERKHFLKDRKCQRQLQKWYQRFQNKHKIEILLFFCELWSTSIVQSFLADF